MTKLRMAIAALGVATMIGGAPLLHAGEKGKEGGKGGKDRATHMQKKLDLSDAQVEKIKAGKKAQMETMKPLREKRKADMASLRSLVEKKAADKDLTAALATLKADQEAIQTQQKKHREEMAAILTPMQQAKTVLMMGKMGEQWADKMAKGKGKRWHKGGHGHADDEDEDEEEKDDHQDGGKH